MPTRLQCPDDGTGLLKVVHHAVEVEVCPTCSGVWLDHGELEKFVELWRNRPVVAPWNAPRPAAIDLDTVDGGIQIVGYLLQAFFND